MHDFITAYNAATSPSERARIAVQVKAMYRELHRGQPVYQPYPIRNKALVKALSTAHRAYVIDRIEFATCLISSVMGKHHREEDMNVSH